MQKLTPEQISACVDGEATSQEMDALVSDVEAHQLWARYHIVRDGLQQELPDAVDFSFAARVAAAIEQEPTVLAPRNNSIKKNVWQTAVGFAVAASVFAVVVGLWRPAPSPQVGNDIANVAVENLTTENVSSIETPDEQQQRLEALLINHTEAASANGLGVMLPYARVVSDRIEIPVSEPIPSDEEQKQAKVKKNKTAPLSSKEPK